MPGTPVVLLHGFTGTRRIWDGVVERLPAGLDAHAIALDGHAYGAPLTADPTVEALADGVERELDALGLGQVPVAGNSLGAWIALELADRGRARAVLGLAPAGFWDPGDTATAERREHIFAAQRRDAQRFKPLLPVLYALPPVRRHALRTMAVRGERVGREQLLEITHGMLACTAYPRVLEVQAPGARRYDLDVPVRVLLSEHDRVFPPDRYEAPIRDRIPGAEVERIDAGHIPMIDAPDLVAAEVAAIAAR